ncbi:MAG TPA: DNA replication and repair protein RecF [Thermoanaerobaculia bacterium]|nr:DNA replication and repair protein RecF [Thermoanaerobaculia bacterium]
MILSRLTTDSFRNLAPAETAFHEQTNILVGRNGQGKTNLLEAIYFLVTTKSFRTPRVQSLFRFDAPSVFVSGVVQREVERTLSVGLEGNVGPALSRSGPAGEPALREPRKRVLLINGERVTLANYLNATTVFAYSSARLEIIRGAPEERRRFLDRGVASIHPAHLDELTRYGRVLKQRNALLQAVSVGDAPASMLDPWDEEFVAAAELVTASRAAYTKQLAAAYEEIVARHDYHVRGVRMVYRPSLADLRATRKEEIRARMSLSGPQRDHLDFLLADGGKSRPAAEVLSGGELKMIVLFLKFAKIELFRRRMDETPIFLLDDVDAELDLEILQNLLARLPARTQLFATSAKESFLQALETGPHRRLTIENGRVTASRDFA